MKLDRIDVGILQALQRDAHVKAVDLAEALGISPSPLYRRIRLLEQAGVITNYVTLLDQEKVGFPVSAYVSVALEKSAEKLAAFERAIPSCEEVMECYLMTGAFDYVVRVVARDMAGIERFVMTRLATIDGVRDVSTSITLRRPYCRYVGRKVRSVHTSPTSDGPRDAGQLVWERDGGNLRMDTRFERREPGRQPMFRPVQPAHDTAPWISNFRT